MISGDVIKVINSNKTVCATEDIDRHMDHSKGQKRMTRSFALSH